VLRAEQTTNDVDDGCLVISSRRIVSEMRRLRRRTHTTGVSARSRIRTDQHLPVLLTRVRSRLLVQRRPALPTRNHHHHLRHPSRTAAAAQEAKKQIAAPAKLDRLVRWVNLAQMAVMEPTDRPALMDFLERTANLIKNQDLAKGHVQPVLLVHLVQAAIAVLMEVLETQDRMANQDHRARRELQANKDHLVPLALLDKREHLVSPAD